MKAIYLLALGDIAAGTSLWASTPASPQDLLRQAYAIGNGKLGVMPHGPAGAEKLNLNIDSLWTGGPFQVEEYRGGNPNGSMYSTLEQVRDFIFENGTGNDSSLYGDVNGYGSFTAAGNLSVAIAGISASTPLSSYNRSLDLDTGVHTTTYRTTTSNNASFTTAVYCSYPAQVCVYSLRSSQSLPAVSISLENLVTANPGGLATSCTADSARLAGLTQSADPGPVGIRWDLVARSSRPGVCQNATGTLVVPASSNRTSLTVVVGGGTDYDASRGNAAAGFSFRAADPPLAAVLDATAAAIKTPESQLQAAHVADYGGLLRGEGSFRLELPDTRGSAGRDLASLMAGYDANATTAGDPYLEGLLIDYGRHLLVSSSREGGLPPNLQGVWSDAESTAWSGDYHADVNLQMNLWGAEQTGLGEAALPPVFAMMQQTWMPRGAETARLLYGTGAGTDNAAGNGSTGAPAWCAHDEMNIFGHTGMKNWPTSADYAVAPAWMMQSVWDRLDYGYGGSDSAAVQAWWRAQGWPLLKGTAQFWLENLQPDRYFGDGSLVVNPCISPEQGPATFGCAHWQQLIYQVFESTLSGASAAGETDAAFLTAVRTSLAALDKGLHIGSWGQVKEWKVSEAAIPLDYNGNQHRHLSPLVGWYPGWALSGLEPSGYAGNATVSAAVRTLLSSRGTGVEDADAGWAKAWRAACWARLNASAEAHYELRLAIDRNFADNGLSMYTGAANPDQPQPPFQIDANFGLVGAALSMLVVDLPLSSAAAAEAEGRSAERTVVLGPAIPPAWAGGSVRGLRIRGGGSVDFAWDDAGVVDRATATGLAAGVRLVNVNGTVLV
ncbi:glycoside hydrolase family 95 protein-like protein [Xylariaceae sp. FL0804]|nr:glycoside hydrolase family 95 protein-like protein [Xylariaceae sp. FL0804]